MTILPNTVYTFNVIRIKLPMSFFTELEQKISQFIWKTKDPKEPKQSWERRMDLEESTFMTSDYTTKLQSSRQYGTGTKNRNIDQWNKIESPEINPCTYGYLIFDKEARICNGTKSLFNKWCWENWTATCKIIKLEHFLTLLVQFSSVNKSCPILCDPMNRSTPGLPVHHQLPESTQTHVHWVSDTIQSSHALSSPSPPALNLSQHQGP